MKSPTDNKNQYNIPPLNEILQKVMKFMKERKSTMKRIAGVLLAGGAITYLAVHDKNTTPTNIPKFPLLEENTKKELLHTQPTIEEKGQSHIAIPYIKHYKPDYPKDAEDMENTDDLIHLSQKEFEQYFVANKIGDREFHALPESEKSKYKSVNGSYWDFAYINTDTRKYLKALKTRFNQKLGGYGYRKELTVVINSLTRSHAAQKKSGKNKAKSFSAHEAGIAADILYNKNADQLTLYYRDKNHDWKLVTNQEVLAVASKTFLQLLNDDIVAGKIIITPESNHCLHIVTNAFGEKPLQSFRDTNSNGKISGHTH